MNTKPEYLLTKSKTLDITVGGLNFLKKRHIFKVFRTSTRFKRWNVGITRVVRKKYIRRKHLTLFMNLNHVTNSWVSFYLSQRNLVRFYQGLDLFSNQFISPSSKVVVSKAVQDLNKNDNGILLINGSSNFLKHLNQVNLTKSFSKNFSQDNLTGLNKVLIYSNKSVWDGVSRDLFNVVRESHDLKFKSNTDILNSNINFKGICNFEYSLLLISRRILIFTALLNTHKNNLIT